METWVRGRATKEAQATEHSVDYLISEILDGNLTKSQVLLTDEYYKVYALHRKIFNDAFESVGEIKSYKAIQSATHNHSKENWNYCLTDSKNAFDQYNGQEILFLDDIRADSLSISDWLKLLDPYTISPISARYHNKMGSAKVIVITSTKHPPAFFREIKNSSQEDLGQFYRRLDLLVEINEEQIKLFQPVKRGKSRNSNLENDFEETNEAYSSLDVPSYKFEKYGVYILNEKNRKNRSMEKIIRKFIENMKWNKKEVKSGIHKRIRNNWKKMSAIKAGKSKMMADNPKK